MFVRGRRLVHFPFPNWVGGGIIGGKRIKEEIRKV